ncbi:MAG TPA: SMP-30/gluconolactonase/LRE family protein [Nannocystaceae bacterium]|nr:SMP-30/gluconolactonase/LRE family protein [Nannocystaceae bacterium]
MAPQADTTTGDPSTTSGTTAPMTTSTTGETTAVAETSTSTTTSSSSSSEAEEEETHTIIFDVGGAEDVNLDDSTTGIVIDWDCDDLTMPYESQAELIAPRGYHDVVFDDDGHIIGWDGNSLLMVTYDDSASVFLPGVNSAQAFDKLENGDYVYTNDFGELRRVTPDLVQTTVTGAVSGAYGVTVGPDQMAYVSTGSAIVRVDPESGEATSWLNTASIHSRAMVFNLDSTGVYISTLSSPSDSVYYQPVDDDLAPEGDMVLFASNVGQGYHDGLGIDACGNLYVPDFNTRGLYRVDPAGTVTMMFNMGTDGPNHYGHGLEWGSGIDGWNDKAIYMPQPYDGNTVLEVVIGAPSGSLVRTWTP